MDISGMLVREDFLNILKDTIEEYYRVVHHKTIEFSYDKIEDSEKIVVNKLLSFVTTSPVPSALFRHLNSEYNIRGNLIKFLLAKSAIVATCVFPNIGKLRNAYMPKGSIGHNVVISPQNRSVRFYDYDNGFVDCIIKQGFTNKYFKAQIDFRRQYKYQFLNPLIDSGEIWFREPILVGHPLVRETNDKRFHKGLKDVNCYLDKIMQDTLNLVDYQTYVETLSRDFERKLDLAVRAKHICTLTQSRHILNHIKSELVKRQITHIPICVSHGDLQTGNIWMMPEGKTLIYDWETVGRRSIWYDKATIGFELRRVWGWQRFLSANDISGIRSMNEICAEFDNDTIKYIILLEDLHFYIDDMLELPEDWGRGDFDVFINRIKPLLR